jgi:hypothetical protein
MAAPPVSGPATAPAGPERRLADAEPGTSSKAAHHQPDVGARRMSLRCVARAHGIFGGRESGMTGRPCHHQPAGVSSSSSTKTLPEVGSNTIRPSRSARRSAAGPLGGVHLDQRRQRTARAPRAPRARRTLPRPTASGAGLQRIRWSRVHSSGQVRHPRHLAETCRRDPGRVATRRTVGLDPASREPRTRSRAASL